MTENIVTATLPEAPYQISDKRGDAILVVRGFTAAETVVAYTELMEEFIAQVPEAATPTPNLQRATNVVTAAFPQAQEAAPAAGVRVCKECGGNRQYRSGTSKKTGKAWGAWDCPTGCAREWAN